MLTVGISNEIVTEVTKDNTAVALKSGMLGDCRYQPQYWTFVGDADWHEGTLCQ